MVVELQDDRWPGVVGVGEGYPGRFYGETPETMAVVIPLLLDAVGEVPPDEAGLSAADPRWMRPSAGTARRAARSTSRSTISSARSRVSPCTSSAASRLTSLPPTSPSASTSPPIVAERAARAAGFPALKIKCGGPEDLATLEAVRAVYGGPIRVDANTGWVPDEAVRLLPSSHDSGSS